MRQDGSRPAPQQLKRILVFVAQQNEARFRQQLHLFHPARLHIGEYHIGRPLARFVPHLASERRAPDHLHTIGGASQGLQPGSHHRGSRCDQY